MNARKTKFYPSRRKLYTAGVFTLALLILVVSCPLKRLVQGDLSVSVSAQKFHRSAFQQSVSADYLAAAACCSLKNKQPHIQENIVKLGEESPSSLVSYLAVVQGFGIYYFLSSVGSNFSSYTPAASLTFPLFLRHLRLRL